MKRIGNLFDAVVEPENLRLAFWKASRGKQDRPDQRAYAARLEEEIAALRLGLDLKTEPYLNRTRHGMDFLGMRVFPVVVRLNRRSKERFAEKARRYGWLLAQGRWTERTYQERMGSPPVSCFRRRNEERMAS